MGPRIPAFQPLFFSITGVSPDAPDADPRMDPNSGGRGRVFDMHFEYPEQMQSVTIALPDELSAALAAPGQDLTRAAFEALVLTAYRERKISTAQLRRLLGYETRMEVDAFLKMHGVELEYTLEDLERDRETHRQLGL